MFGTFRFCKCCSNLEFLKIHITCLYIGSHIHNFFSKHRFFVPQSDAKRLEEFAEKHRSKMNYNCYGYSEFLKYTKSSSVDIQTIIFRFLHHKTTFLDPLKLIEEGIRVSFTIQYPGDVMICK